MYIDTSSIKRNQKVYTRHLLRSSSRENGKVKHKTIANLSGCSEAEINAIKLALKHKNNLAALGLITDISTVLGKRIGAAWTLKEVTLVGDRGMLKGPQIDQLPDDFRYITAITKTQILKMLEDRVIQYELFTDKVCEVGYNGTRYVLRRNPMRAKEMAMTRESKQASAEKLAQDLTRYLAEHGKASIDAALKKATAKIQKLKTEKWLRVIAGQRMISIETDEAALEEEALLDGCYVIKSDVPKDNADAEILHERYCDLENVERAFRTMKTSHLEMRPVFVRKEQSTRGHAFVVMLALLLQRELEGCWADMDITVREGIDELAAIYVEEIKVGNTTIRKIPTPNEIGKQLLEKAGIDLPSVLPGRVTNVHTKKKLPSERLK